MIAIERHRRRRQPSGHVELDWSHPANDGMQFFHYFGNNYAPGSLGPVAVSYDSTNSTGATTRAGGFDGVGLLANNGVTPTRWVLSTFPAVPASTAFTAFMWAAWNSGGANTSGRAFSYRNQLGSGLICAGMGNDGVSGNANAPSWLLRDDGGTLVHANSSTAITDNLAHLFAVSRDSSGNANGWFDESKTALGTVSGAFTLTYPNCNYARDNLNTPLGSWNGVIYYAGFVLGYEWDYSVVREIVKSPWGLFRSRRRLYFGVTAGAPSVFPTYYYAQQRIQAH